MKIAALYGAGKKSLLAEQILRRYAHDVRVDFLVENRNFHQLGVAIPRLGESLGKPMEVISLAKLKKLYAEKLCHCVIVPAAYSIFDLREIDRHCNNIGISRCDFLAMPYNRLMMPIEVNDYTLPLLVTFSELEQMQIWHMDVHVVDHCNLSCKACGHFSCLVEKPVFYDIDRLAGSLAKLAELVPNICRFGVVGGEPLLHPDLAAILDLIHDRFPFAQILMSTNGLLLSQMPDALIDAIKANHVCVGLSLYPPMHDEIDGIVALLKEMGFDYCVMRVDSFERRFLPRPVFNKQQMFDKCGHIMCLRGSRVGYCVNALFTDYYNKRFGKDLLPEDSGVDMFIYADGKSFLEALHQPLDLCRQCVACDTGKQYFRAWALAGKTPRAEDWFIDFPFEAALARNGE